MNTEKVLNQDRNKKCRKYEGRKWQIISTEMNGQLQQSFYCCFKNK